MNATPATITAVAQADNASSVAAFTSVTIWSDGNYFLQVHYGNFDSWEDAEDFASVGTLRLETRSQALYLVGPHGAAWISDQALTIYRDFGNSFGGSGTFDMTLDDLLEVADVEDMSLRAIGSQPVTRGRPVIARAIDAMELTAASAANDEEA